MERNRKRPGLQNKNKRIEFFRQEAEKAFAAKSERRLKPKNESSLFDKNSAYKRTEPITNGCHILQLTS